MVVQSPPLDQSGGLKWRDSFPERSDYLGAPQSSGTKFLFLLRINKMCDDKRGIGTLDRKMTSFRQSENIIAL